MNNRPGLCIRFVNRGVRQRLRRSDRGSLTSEPVSFEIVSHHSRAIRQRQFGHSASRRTCDVKFVGGAVSYAQVAEPNAICVHTDQSELEKFPPVCIQFGKTAERTDLCSRVFAREFYVFAHGACSGKSARILFSFASHTPRSVISPVTRRLGVTSNPEFAAGLPSGVTRTSTCRPSSHPSACFTSSAPRSSIGISFNPSRIS